jgi:zinc and cadmium transporter
MFFLQRVSHFHQHEASDHDLHGAGHVHHDGGGHEASTMPVRPVGDVEGGAASGAAHTVSWMAVAAGLGVHGLLDGAALGAALRAEEDSLSWWPPAGLGTLLAILLHKPFDALTINLLLARSGAGAAWRQSINLLYACVTPAGVVLFELIQRIHGTHWTGIALALTGGSFLCIAASDLLPELQFHRHDRWKLSAALLLGVLLAWLVGRAHAA